MSPQSAAATEARQKAAVASGAAKHGPSPFATESDRTAATSRLAPLEARLLELNLERDALSMEYDRLLPQGSKTMANRRRVAELEARLGAVNRECSDLRLELKHAAAASTAEIGGTA